MDRDNIEGLLKRYTTKLKDIQETIESQKQKNRETHPSKLSFLAVYDVAQYEGKEIMLKSVIRDIEKILGNSIQQKTLIANEHK